MTIYYFLVSFGVEADMVEPFLEGSTLEQAMLDKKIFLVDLTIAEDASEESPEHSV